MSLLSFFFGENKSPVDDWPAAPSEPPVVDLRSERVGTIPFNSPFLELRGLGKPDLFDGDSDEYSELAYSSGWSVECEEGKLVFLTYYLGQDILLPKITPFRFSKPSVIARDGTLHTFDEHTEAPALVAAFGEPDGADLNEEDSVISWTSGNLTIEAELNERTKLTRLNIFLTE